MGLADIITAVEALLSGVKSDFGEDKLTVQDAPPRIVWVPAPDNFSGAQRTGPSSSIQRTIKTRNAAVELHVWGAGTAVDTDKYKDLKATELLVNRVLVAIHTVCWGAYELESGRWMEKGLAHLGRAYVVNLRFFVPVASTSTADANQTVTITSVTQVGTEVLPSGDVTGTPAP